MNITIIILIICAIGIVIGVAVWMRSMFATKQAVLESTLPSDAHSTFADNKRILKNQILNKLVNEKIFLDKELDLHKLAKAVHSNRNYVSQVINHELNMNFYQLINSYRIKEFEELLLKLGNIEKANIKELSGQAGFKSFSSFNACFKETKGMTPGEYKKSLRLPSLF